MPTLSPEGADNADPGSAKHTSSASYDPSAAQQACQHTSPRNAVDPNPHTLPSAHQRTTPRSRLHSNNTSSLNSSESYPFGPDHIVGYDAGLQLPRDAAQAVNVLVRLLFDILVYSYDIDFHELHYALAASSPHLCTANLSTRNTSLLTFQEMRVVLEYADAIHKACDAVLDNTLSVLKDDDRNLIINYIMLPAQTIGIDVAYVFEQLYAFRLHRCDSGNHNKTLLYTKTSFWTRRRGLLPGKLGMDKNQKLLARRLVSDDIAVAQLGTRSNEALSLVLGKAIKDYNKKHCKYGMANIKRNVYAEPPFIALRKEVMWWELLRAKSTQDAGQPSTSSTQEDYRMSQQSRFSMVEQQNLMGNTPCFRMGTQPDLSPRRNTRKPRSLHDLQYVQERPEGLTRPQSTSNLRSSVLPPRTYPARPTLR